MYDFAYLKADSIDDAAAKLRGYEEAKLLAGGMNFAADFEAASGEPNRIYRPRRHPRLAGIKVDGAAVTVGAMTRHIDVAKSRDLQKAIPARAYLASRIGDPAVRNRGTIGGSISNNDPAADYPSALLALDAVVKTNRREIKADDFFTGMFETTLEHGEIVTAVTFPVPERAAYMKFPNRHRATPWWAFSWPKRNPVRGSRSPAGRAVFHQRDMEAALSNKWSSDASANVRQSPEGLNSDIHASAEYRAHLVTIMAKRAVQAADKGSVSPTRAAWSAAVTRGYMPEQIICQPTNSGL